MAKIVSNYGFLPVVDITQAFFISMKNIVLALIVYMFSHNVVADTCASDESYLCLVNNSFDVYMKSPESWWRIYYSGLSKAKECKNYSDMSQYLKLWAGGTDGEMSEGLTEDTANLIFSNPNCFIFGLAGTSELARNGLLSRFCPWSDKEKVLRSINTMSVHPDFSEIIHRLINKIEKCEY